MIRFASAFLVGVFVIVSQAEAFSSAEKSSVASPVAAMSPMPAVRRVGILPARTNVTAFRTFLRDEARSTSGFLAIPMTEEQVSRELSRMVVRATASSGRFWSLSLDALVELSGVAQSTKDYSSAELRLQKSYDLDAWIEPEISFSPDHTKLRLTARSVRDRSFIVAREDVLFDAMPSGADIEKNFHNALARIAATLGHDGRVTWRKDNLLVVDFGKERGLVPGSMLGAGYVILSARHPVSHEYLRSQKIETLELEVVEARDGSSLCKIVKRNPLMETEANNLMPGLTEKGVLAWRKDAQGATWGEFEAAKSGAIVSGVESGFRTDAPETAVPLAGQSTQNASAETKNEQIKNEPKREGTVRELPQSAETTAVQAETEQKFEAHTKPLSRGAESAESTEESEAGSDLGELSDFSKWKLAGFFVGAGIAGGSLDTAGGEKSADVLQSTVLNSVRVGGTFTFSREIYAAPKASFHHFSGTVDGYRLDTELPIMFSLFGDVSRSGSLPGTVAVGAGPLVILGSAEASYRLSNKSRKATQEFSALDMLLKGSWLAEIREFGEVGAEVGIPLIELIGGSTAIDARVSGRPFAFAPKSLGFYAGCRFGPGIWNGWDVGASWKL
jgi:hypothetical protein